MQAISLPLRRCLALALLLTVLALGWTLAIQPLIDLSRDRRDDIAALSDQLAHLKSIIARRPDVERRAVSDRAALDAEGGLWAEASAAEVAAGMQDRLRKVIAGSGGQLRSTAVVSEAMDHGFRRVTVHFSVASVLDTVQATLAAIHSARPAMFVDSVAIHAITSGDAHNPPTLTMDLDVSSYMAVPGT
jgi:general secretion pathway protein M